MTFDCALGDFLIWLVAIVVPGVSFDDEAAGLQAQAGFAVRDGMRIARERCEPTTLAELQAYYPSSPEIERTTALWLQAIDAAPKLRRAGLDSRYWSADRYPSGSPKSRALMSGEGPQRLSAR